MGLDCQDKSPSSAPLSCVPAMFISRNWLRYDDLMLTSSPLPTVPSNLSRPDPSGETLSLLAYLFLHYLGVPPMLSFETRDEKFRLSSIRHHWRNSRRWN